MHLAYIQCSSLTYCMAGSNKINHVFNFFKLRVKY